MVNGYAPTNLAEALRLRSEETLTPYAGGTDLMIKEDRTDAFLFLHKIPELKAVSEDAENVYIGAACSYTSLLENGLIPEALKDAMSRIAAPAIRNEGTVGGNIANASPKADSALILFAADALVKLQSARAERVIPIKDFYVGRGKTVLESDELLTQIVLPKRWLGGYYYKKIGARKALAISRLSFCGLLGMEGVDGKDGTDGDRIAHVACAFGAVSDVIIRHADIDRMFVGKTREEARSLRADYLKAYDEAIVPIQGRVSADYRKRVCLNLLEDFLDQRVFRDNCTACI
ncbi:MAG: FAD binding domain-containing protein [Clostridiales Family XIII bacterium]|jgi:CO/xanthine dehydrogenase FAD-binding subunit|nr:FAD binding domain-containing protein [Clostridiales Family XIII bacterium]